MDLLEKINTIKQEIKAFKALDNDHIEAFRLKFISRKGIMSNLFDEFKAVPNNHKKAVGQALNELKNEALAKFQELASSLKAQDGSSLSSGLDQVRKETLRMYRSQVRTSIQPCWRWRAWN